MNLPSGKLTQLVKMAHVQLIYALKMVIFHSYVSLPEDAYRRENLELDMLLQGDVPIAETCWGFQLEMFDDKARVRAKVAHSRVGYPTTCKIVGAI